MPGTKITKNLNSRLGSMKMTRSGNRSRISKGFSILELLIAVIIIGILAAILIPIIGNRAAKARIAAAESDLERIGSAMERVSIDVAYMVRLWALDDVPGAITSLAEVNPDGTVYNTVRDWDEADFYFQNARNALFINITGDDTGDFLGTTANSTLFDRIQINETDFNWNGPYISYNSDDQAYAAWLGISAPDGLPDDPWGENYLLFTREGLVLEPEGQIVTSSNFPLTNSNGTSGSFDCTVFDRSVVLSLGPNGAPGNGTPTGILGTDDDLVRAIGP